MAVPWWRRLAKVWKNPSRRNRYLVSAVAVLFMLLVGDVLFILGIVRRHRYGTRTLRELFRSGKALTTDKKCPQQCEFRSGAGADTAQALLLDLQKPLPCHKRDNQIWIGFTRSRFWLPSMADSAVMRELDFLVGSVTESQLPILQPKVAKEIYRVEEIREEPIVGFEERSSRDWVAAHLCSSRTGYTRQVFIELQQNSVTCVNYGLCDPRTKELVTDLLAQHGSTSEKEVAQNLFEGHLFTLVGESDDCDNHHTVGILAAYRAGSVPIYVGAQTIKLYVPSQSLVVASDFNGPVELAAYIRRVASDASLYSSFHAWRKDGNLPVPKIYEDRKSAEFLCSLCKAANSRPHQGMTAVGPSCFEQEAELRRYGREPCREDVARATQTRSVF